MMIATLLRKIARIEEIIVTFRRNVVPISEQVMGVITIINIINDLTTIDVMTVDIVMTIDRKGMIEDTTERVHVIEGVARPIQEYHAVTIVVPTM